MKISEIKLNDRNPRTIKDSRFKKLVESIRDFPAMMELRPIVVNKEGVILGGNMRFRACKELGMKEIPDNWVKTADKLTEEEEKRFIIEDNIEFGDWDFDILANEWEIEELEVFGIVLDGLKSQDEERELLFNDDQFIEIQITVRQVWFDHVHKRVRKLMDGVDIGEIDERCINFLIYCKRIYDIMKTRDKPGTGRSKRYALYVPISYQDLCNFQDKANGDLLQFIQSKLNG